MHRWTKGLNNWMPEGKDAFKSFENITSELEEGYKALQAARLAHEQKAV